MFAGEMFIINEPRVVFFKSINYLTFFKTFLDVCIYVRFIPKWQAEIHESLMLPF